jgi:hypothetical protein
VAEVSYYIDENIGVEVLTPLTPSDYAAQNVGVEEKVGAQPSLVLVQNPGDYAVGHVSDQLGPEFAFAPRLESLVPPYGRVGNTVVFEGLGFGDECVFLRFGQDDAYDASGYWVQGSSHAYGVFTSTQTTWTLEAWFRSQRQGPYEDPTGESTGSLVELCTNGAPVLTRYILELNQGHVRAKHGATILTTLGHYDDGDWHAVRLVYAGGSLHLLVDGVLVASAAVTNHAIDYMRVGGTASYVEADVREMQIVQANLGVVNYAPEWEYSPNPNTVGLWHFDDGAGATVADFSGNDSDLTLDGDDYGWIDWDFELEVLLNELICGGPTGVRNRRGIFTVPVDAESGQVHTLHTRVHEDESNSRTFTVLSEEPLRGIGVEVRVYDRDNFGTLLAILENAFGVGASLELDNTGAGKFSIHASDLKATTTNLAHGNLVRIYYDGIERCAFLIEQVEEVVLEEGEESVQGYNVAGRGPFALLDNAVVYPPNWPDREPLLTSYVDRTPGYILADQVAKAAARGALLGMTVGFTDEVDSNGELWPETFTMDVEPGITLTSLLNQFVTMGYNAYVTSGIKLKVYVSRGIDRTVGQAPTTFRQGYNLYSKHRKSTSGSVKTIALVASDSGLSEFAKASSFPRRETFMDATKQDISTAGRAAALALASLSEADEGFTSVVESIIGASEVFENFDIGDWVYVDVPGKINMERFRVRAITLEVGDDSAAHWTVGFNSVQYEWSIRIKRLIDGMSAGSATGSTASGQLNPINPTTGVNIPGRQQFMFGVRITTDDEGAFIVEAADLTSVLVVDTIAGTVTVKKLVQSNSEEPNMVLAGPAAAPAAPPAFRVLDDADIPAAIMRDAEHTAIGDGPPHHAAVTLDPGSDPALELEGQVLKLTLPPPGGDGGTLADVMIGKGQWGDMQPGYSSTVASRTGLYAGGTLTISGTDSYCLEDADGMYANFLSGAVSGNEGGFAFLTAQKVHTRRQSPRILLKLKLVSIANVRCFFGLSNQTLVTMAGADDPAGHYVGVQFSTPRADTNWRFVSKDNVTQNIVDSGIAASTGAVYVRITVDDTVPNILVELLDAAYEVLASHTFVANLPGQTTSTGPVCGLETQTTVGKSWQFYFLRGVHPNV